MCIYGPFGWVWENLTVEWDPVNGERYQRNPQKAHSWEDVMTHTS